LIIKASQRSGGAKLAAHLLNADLNDHIDIHEIRGLSAPDLPAAFQEITLQATGTRCEQPFFSVSFNPPAGQSVSVEQFEDAFSRVEKKLGLENQPRAVIFHEKEGRRHAHVVWSRIDTDKNRAINLSHYRAKLNDIARDLYKDHGWTLPSGFQKGQKASRENYTRTEWQQTQRAGLDPKTIKAFLRKALEQSDNRAAFEAALQERGYTLARGDRRGFIVVTERGEPISLTRYTGEKNKAITERLGRIDALPTLDQVKILIENRKSATLEAKLDEQKTHHQAERKTFKDRLDELRKQQRTERHALGRAQAERWQREERERAERLRSGIIGFLERVTGKTGKIDRKNAKERKQCRRRDLAERQDVIDRQLQERQSLKQEYSALIARQDRTRQTLRQAFPQQEATPDTETARRAFEAARKVEKARENAQEAEREAGRGQGRHFTLDREP